MTAPDLCEREQPPAETLLHLWNPPKPPRWHPNRRICKPMGEDSVMQAETLDGEAVKLREYMEQRARERTVKRKRLLSFLRQNRPTAFTISQLMALTPMSKSTLKNHLDSLRIQGFVESTGRLVPSYWIATGRKGEPE